MGRNLSVIERVGRWTVASLLLAAAALAVGLLWMWNSEQIKETYSTYADARRAGAVERDWIPTFVPSSARNIADSHNLDTNRQTLQFTVPPSGIGKMVAGLRSTSVNDQRAAAELSNEYMLGAASETYIVCSEHLNGALAVDRQTGRAVYDTTVGWADDDCS